MVIFYKQNEGERVKLGHFLVQAWWHLKKGRFQVPWLEYLEELYSNFIIFYNSIHLGSTNLQQKKQCVRTIKSQRESENYLFYFQIDFKQSNDLEI